MKHGFFTPTSLHYVRNHGAVPKLDWATHTLEISGPMKLTMDEIVAMPSVELPVTVACSGNRRKEQNMISKGTGFHWGPGAVATSVWRGVRLADVLHRCGIKSSTDGKLARFVCFEGADRLASDYYGTSIPIERALDDHFDVLLAYEMNGERLPPDHGYPLRTSENHYHRYDNRVLPPGIDNLVTAAASDAWSDPDDVIYDFNIQSVITHPTHLECVPLNIDTNYTLHGYAYSGSGLKIKRVQISLDSGQSWRMAQLEHPEEANLPGGHRDWCWRLWSLDVPVKDLFGCEELVCRAWDVNNNTQPQTAPWNLSGMMHNGWYTVKAHIKRTHQDRAVDEKDDPEQSVVSLCFQHPAVVGDNEAESWMKPPRRDPQEVTTLSEKTLADPDMVRLTRDEVAKHTGPSDAWVIVHEKVYDCSAFLDEHPGGAASILSAAGTDVTKVFKEIHSIMTHEIFGNYLLGEIDDLICEGTGMAMGRGNDGRTFLSPQWQPIRLATKKSLSHDTRLFRFELSDSDIQFGLPVGKHVFLRGKAKDDKAFVRAYTPVSENNLQGFVEFVIKVYGPTKAFPEGGHLSQLLDSLPIGGTVDVRGPLGSFSYIGRGRWVFGALSGRAKRIVMMSGGTGITPIYQVVRAVAQDPQDFTEVRLIYANKTEEDILLREELVQLEKKSHGRIKISFTLSNPPKDWDGLSGHIDERMIREHATFESHDSLNHSIDTISVLCGPPGLIEKACLPNIVKVYGKDMMQMRTFHF
ncbi:hypothetical protein BGX34_001812 [Mortierella sp. NVP85]|nr:hypothetical protein BGX34_001812 [Mortierella sp. NVP85]